MLMSSVAFLLLFHSLSLSLSVCLFLPRCLFVACFSYASLLTLKKHADSQENYKRGDKFALPGVSVQLFRVIIKIGDVAAIALLKQRAENNNSHALGDTWLVWNAI